MLNVSERKQAEQALLDSQNRFQVMLNQAITGVVQVDKNGRITLVSQCWCEMTGYREAELLRMGLLDITHETSLNVTEEAVNRIANGEPDFVMDNRYKRKDGTSFWATSSVHALRDHMDQFIGLVAIVRDITERKHAEEVLQSSEKYRSILQSITEGFLGLDENWCFTYANRAAETILNRTSDDLVGKNLWEEYPGLKGTEFERHYLHAATQHEEVTFTAFYADHKRWYEIHVYPAPDGICIYFRNVTEVIEAQSILRLRDERSRLIADISARLVLRASNVRPESIDELLESVFTEVAQHLNAEYYFSYMAEGPQTLRLVSSRGLSAEDRHALSLVPFGEHLCGTVANMRQPLAIEELQSCTLVNARVLNELGVTAYAGFPLLADGQLLGTICLATARRERFTSEELELVQTVVDLLASAVQRDRATVALQTNEQKYRSLFESIDEGFCTIEVLFDDNRRPIDYLYLEMNPAFEKQSGLQNAVGKRIKELAPDIEEHWIETLGKVALTGKPIRFENYAAPMKRWFNCYGFCLDQNQPSKICVIFSDVTERKRRELDLALMAEIQQDFAIFTDSAKTLQSVGESMCRHFGFASLGFADINENADLAITVYSSEPWAESTHASHHLLDYFNKHHLAQLKAGKAVAINDVMKASIKRGGAAYAAYQVGSIINAPYLSDGRWKFLISGTHREPYQWRTDEIELLMELTERIYLHLERARSEIRVRESEQRYRALIDASSQVMYRMSPDLNCLSLIDGGDFIASSAEPQYDWLKNYVHPEDQTLVMRTWHEARQRKDKFELEHRIRRIDGSWGWVASRAVPLVNDKDEIIEWFGAASDITDRKNFEDTLWQHANFDSLTALPNRRLFRDRLEQELKKAHRSGHTVALFFIDLDRFKEVNDLHGHAVGDALLVEASKRIAACVREFDTVARLGGDEFTAILSDLDDKTDSEVVAQKIIDALAKPFQLCEELVYLSSSLGITFYPDDATNADDMIRNADQAMYAAKYGGRNQYNFFIQRMQHEATDRLRLIEDLRMAASNRELEVYYQPIIDLATGKIVKAEALLRWHHPVQGEIDPSVFIPFAEDSGLINDIGDWVFTEAAACSNACEAQSGKHFQISVNKSPLQFRTSATCMDWISYLEHHHMLGSSVSVEITEGMLLNTSEEIRNKLMQFRNAGIQIAIDDFGTGYSSMTYLKEFEIDYLKIDQSFIHSMATDKAHFAIVRSMIAMAHELEIKVIAEGIETPLQKDLLAEAGCDFGQGFLFSEAIPHAEFVHLVKTDTAQHQANKAWRGLSACDQVSN